MRVRLKKVNVNIAYLGVLYHEFYELTNFTNLRVDTQLSTYRLVKFVNS